MKRLSWLLFAIFCTALVRVQAIDGTKAKACNCCHCGAGGTDSCCPPAASLPAALSSAQSARVASSPACRKARSARTAVAQFYAWFIEPAAVRTALLASAQAAPAAHVPLFKAHCRFLI